MTPPSSHSTSAGSGVLGSHGRYPLHESAPLALQLDGVPIIPVGPLRMYTCGITPYDVTHVGHAATFVWADLVATLAHALGSEAVVARNVTDIDDVLTEAARDRGWHYDELALAQEFLFDRDMRALSVAAPTVAPHARSHIPALTRLAAALLATGAAYQVGGFVMFRGEPVVERSGLSREQALAASHSYGDQEGLPERESVFDVPVWRPSPADHPAWPSPWGWGRPGWHAECAAMAVCALGSSVEVLLGGEDLTFPHHAYQQAMVEAATGVRPFARAVVHVGEVRVEGAKMAKSTGNLVLVSDLVQHHPPAAVRFTLLHRPWSQPWDCSAAEFERAGSVLAQLQELADRDGSGAEARGVEAQGAAALESGVLSSLACELDVPGAVERALGGGPAAAQALLRLLKVS